MFISRANAASWLSSCSAPSQPLLKTLLWSPLEIQGVRRLLDGKTGTRQTRANATVSAAALSTFSLSSLLWVKFVYNYGYWDWICVCRQAKTEINKSEYFSLFNIPRRWSLTHFAAASLLFYIKSHDNRLLSPSVSAKLTCSAYIRKNSFIDILNMQSLSNLRETSKF